MEETSDASERALFETMEALKEMCILKKADINKVKYLIGYGHCIIINGEADELCALFVRTKKRKTV